MKVLVLLLAASAASQASLIQVSSTAISGAGLGNVSTVLTLQSQGAGTTEAGCVLAGATSGVGTACSAFGSTTAFAGGTVMTGTSQIGSPTLGALDVLNASDLRIVLNATEPSGNAITVEQLALNFYNGATVLGGTTHSLQSAITIPNTLTGVGQAGFAFRLDDTQAGQVDTQLAGLTAAQRAAVQVRLAARLSGAEGGPDTFFVAKANTGSPIGASEVPEPASMTLVGSALLGAGVLTLRRRKRA